MAERRKKKKFSLKKLKKIILSIFKKIGDFFKNIYKNFMSLPSKIRYIIYVWCVIFLLVVVLIAGTSSNNRLVERYQEAENKINEAAIRYVDLNGIFPTRDSKLKLSMEILKDLKYVSESDIGDDTCVGFSLLYYDDEEDKYHSDTYIKCEKYTSEGYSDYK